LNFIELCILGLWKVIVWAKILESVLEELHEKHAVQRGICVSILQLFLPSKLNGNPSSTWPVARPSGCIPASSLQSRALVVFSPCTVA